ncbi:MAG: site-specific integrase [Pseudomonadota bacterium]
MSDSTIRRELGVLQAALNHGHSEMGLPQPTKLWKPTESPPLDRWLSEEEIAALLEVSPEHLRRFILISVFTGRRKGAVLGLRWEHGPSNGSIDFETNRVQFIGDAENETSKRKGTILMPEQLRQHLLGWKEDGFASVVHYEGKPVKDIDTSFATACKKANISGVKPHVLKHTAVTHAFRKGMTLTDAVEFFATSSQTLEPTYRHHSPLYQENAAGLMTFDNPSFVANKVAAQ